MYEAIFQSADRPFRATPDARFYYPAESIEQARQTLLRVVRRAEGPAMVMGASGLGKSMLAQIIARDLSDLFDVVKLHATSLCSRRALLQNVLFELRLPYRELTEGELRLSLLDRMERSPDCAPKGLLLIVDEAHTLPVKLLEELRLISNFVRDGEPRARLVLIGGLQLEETFARPQLNSFNQRLAARCYLQPMNRQQTQAFVAHQLRCIGTEPQELITRDALDAVYSASEGIARLANQVMDHALVLAITSGQCPISVSLIEEAWADLQQLPAPWHGSIASQNTAPVEFAAIEDDETDGDEEQPLSTQLPNAFYGDMSGSVDISVDSVLVELPSATQGAEHPNYFANFGSSPTHDNNAPLTISFPDEASLNQCSDIEHSVVNQSVEPIQISLDSAQDYCEVECTTGDQATLGIASDADSDRDMLVFEEEPEVDLSPLLASAQSDIDLWNESFHPLESLSSVDYQLPVGAAEIPETIQFSNPQLQATTLFGEDFDEEFEITSRPSQLRSRSTTSVGQFGDADTPWDNQQFSINLDGRENEAVEQLAAMEDSLQQLQIDQPSAAQDFAPAASAAAMPPEQQSWQVDTALTSANMETALHEEIEDLISQLNFSAFSVDPVSIEQISVDYSRDAAPAVGVPLETPNEQEPAIFSLSQDPQDDLESSLDDDREMLIVEDDIPLSMKLASVPNTPVRSEAQSYSRLFTKLRS